MESPFCIPQSYSLVTELIFRYIKQRIFSGSIMASVVYLVPLVSCSQIPRGILSQGTFHSQVKCPLGFSCPQGAVSCPRGDLFTTGESVPQTRIIFY